MIRFRSSMQQMLKKSVVLKTNILNIMIYTKTQDKDVRDVLENHKSDVDLNT